MPPLVAELYAQGRTRRLERTLRVGATIVGVPALAVLMVFVVAAPWVLEVVYGPFYRQAAPLLLVMSLARVIAVWTRSSGVDLMMTGHQRDMMHTTLLSAVISIVGGLLLAGPYGAMGVAVATSVAQVVQNVSQLLLAHRRLGIWTHVSFSWVEVREFFPAIGALRVRRRRAARARSDRSVTRRRAPEFGQASRGAVYTGPIVRTSSRARKATS